MKRLSSAAAGILLCTTAMSQIIPDTDKQGSKELLHCSSSSMGDGYEVTIFTSGDQIFMRAAECNLWKYRCMDYIVEFGTHEVRKVYDSYIGESGELRFNANNSNVTFKNYEPKALFTFQKDHCHKI